MQIMHKNVIAEAMGRSIASIENRAVFLNVKILPTFGKYTAEGIATIVQMRRDKVCYKAIAEKLGRSDLAVRAKYYKHRPLHGSDAEVKEIMRSGLSLDELESVRTLRAQEVSWPEIGRQYPMHDLNRLRKTRSGFLQGSLFRLPRCASSNAYATRACRGTK